MLVSTSIQIKSLFKRFNLSIADTFEPWEDIRLISSQTKKITEAKKKEFLKKLSPTAWSHVLLLGFFQFFSDFQKFFMRC